MANKTIQINIDSNDNASGNIKKVSSSLKGLYGGISSVNNTMDRFTMKLRQYNNTMSYVNSIYVSGFRSATNAIIDFTSDAINSYSQLEQQHAKTLGAMASDYDKSVAGQQKLIDNGEKLKKQAIDLAKYGSNGKGSLTSAVEISSAQTALVKAGKSADQMLSVSKSTNKTPVQTVTEFAKGNDLSVDTAVDFAVTLGQQFKYPMDKWGEMLDKVSHAADTSVISVEDIVNSMKYAGGIASGLNRPMEEVLSMLSVMGNAGLKGSLAGTGVQAFFTRLLASGSTITDTALKKAPGKAADVYQEFYDKIVDNGGDMTDMDSVLAELDTAMEDLNDEEQTWFARKVFSLFQMKAAYALTGSSDGDIFAETMNDIKKNSSGTNEKKYDYLLDSQYGRMEAVKQAWKATKTDIGDKMAPMVMTISDEVLEYLQNNGKYNFDRSKIESAIDKSRDNIADAYGNDVADFIASLADTVVNAGIIGEALLPEAGGIGKAFVKLMNGDVSGAFDALSESLDKTNTNIDALPDELQEMATAVKNVIVALTALAAINTTANVISSVTTIWGATGGMLLGGLGAGAKGLSKASSYEFYKNMSSAGKFSGSSGKLFANGGFGIFDELFGIEKKIANEDFEYKVSSDVTDYKYMEAHNNRIRDLNDKLYTKKGNLTNEQSDEYRIYRDKRIQEDRAAQYAKEEAEALARKERIASSAKKIIGNKDNISTDKMDIIDSANGNMGWYKNRVAKPVQGNIIDYESAQAEFADELGKRKLEEVKATMKSIAVEKAKTRAIEDQIATQKTLINVQKQVTSDLLDVAKKSADRASKIGKTVPSYTSVHAKKPSTSGIGAGTGTKSTVNGGATGAEEASYAYGTSAKAIEGSTSGVGAESGVKGAKSSAKASKSDPKINIKTKVGPKPTGVYSDDDILNAARKLNKENLNDMFKDFTSKYGINERTMMEYANDKVHNSKVSADDIIRQLNERPDMMAKYISKAYGSENDVNAVNDALKKSAWDALPKGTKAAKIAGGVGKVGFKVGYGVTLGLLQDQMFEAYVKAQSGGATSQELLNNVTSDTKYNKIGINAYNEAFGQYSSAKKSSADNDVMNAIANSIGFKQGFIKSFTGTYPGSHYYEPGKYVADMNTGQVKNTAKQSNMVSTYGYIDGILQAIYTDAKSRNINVTSGDIGKQASLMYEQVIKDMKDSGVKQDDISKKTVFDQHTLDVMAEAFKKSLIGMDFNGKPYSMDYMREQYNKTHNVGGNSMFTMAGFSPVIKVNVSMTSAGKVLNTTTTLEDYNKLIDWTMMQKSRITK